MVAEALSVRFRGLPTTSEPRSLRRTGLFSPPAATSECLIRWVDRTGRAPRGVWAGLSSTRTGRARGWGWAAGCVSQPARTAFVPWNWAQFGRRGRLRPALPARGSGVVEQVPSEKIQNEIRARMGVIISVSVLHKHNKLDVTSEFPCTVGFKSLSNSTQHRESKNSKRAKQHK